MQIERKELGMEGVSDRPVTHEEVDVVIVGSRVSGSAAAVAFARAGRRVVALDRVEFPSDTLSTHIMSAGSVGELKLVGALDRVLATGAPKLPFWKFMTTPEASPLGRYSRVNGVDFGLCVRRIGLDAALVDTARAEGAEVREHASARELVWSGGRVAGVRYEDADGALHEIRAKLVVGADGRRSSVARWVGVEQPYRRWRNGRGMIFRYYADPRPPEERDALIMWRYGDQTSFLFPTYDGDSLCLLQPPTEEVRAFRADPEGMWELALAKVPPLRERLEGCTPNGKIRIAPEDLSSYFRTSTGPGWALVGDAGHFKDPIIGQGMHDGLRFGRRLGEIAADVLEDERALDAALIEWELERDWTVMPSVYFAGRLARPDSLTGPEREMCRQMDVDRQMGDDGADFWARRLPMADYLSWKRKFAWGSRALRRGTIRPRELALFMREEIRLDVGLALERRVLKSGRRSRARTWSTWERNGWPAGMTPDGMTWDERAPRSPWAARNEIPPSTSPNAAPALQPPPAEEPAGVTGAGIREVQAA